MRPVVAVHGGAGRWDVDKERRRAALEALRDAVEAGLTAAERGDAVDAVVAAVEHMEKGGVFDAGYGAVYAIDGRAYLDAGVMDGRSGRAGAVAAVEAVKSAVRLARFVM